MDFVRAAIFFSGTFILSLPGRPAELIHLRSGFDLEAQTHTLAGTTLTLITRTGTIEVPQADVLGMDPLPELPENTKAVPVAAPPTLLSIIKSAAESQAATPEFIRFVRCVAQVESALRPDARSSKGASGLMQLMPATAKSLGVIASNAQDNVRGGAKYLRELLIKYHSDSVLALAAYNAGPGAVKRYGGVPPYSETRRYIQKVLQEYARLKMADETSQ